jgi:hypothetical protein
MQRPRSADSHRELRLGTIGTSSLHVTVGIPIALLAIVLMVAFAAFSSARTELAFCAAVVAGAAGVYSAYSGAANLRGQVELAKKRHALEFIQHWPTEQRARERGLLRKRLQPDTMAPEELVRIVREHEELEGAARTHLNFIHAIAIAIQRDIVDEPTVFDYFHLIVRDTVNLLEAYIDAEQRGSAQEAIWAPVLWIDRSWRDR